LVAQTSLEKATGGDTDRRVLTNSVKRDTSRKSGSTATDSKTSKQFKRPGNLKTNTDGLSRFQVTKKPLIGRRAADNPKKADSLRKANSLAKDVLAASASDIRKITQADTTKPVATDVSKTVVSSSMKKATVLAKKKPLDSFYLKLLDNPYLKITGEPVYLVIKERQPQSKDEMFYLLAGLLLVLAILRLAFPKYFKNIFYLFFQPTFRQKQIREQLLQRSFPSLLLNIFFILSAAAYISLIITYYHLANFNFLQLLVQVFALLLALYAGKFFFLTFAGWVFDVKEATDTYIFAVYLINKMLGILLIPFTFIIAFSPHQLVETSITISLLLIGLLFIYRYLVSFRAILKEMRLNALQFLFYIFAFEIVPLLLIYKTLVNYLNKSL
jgi:hypothetical protein